jgi:cytoplasmic tRNA 2-thiolation protein 1
MSNYGSLKCSHCGQAAFYRRKYSGEALCPKCFKSSVIEKTRRTISRYNLVHYGEKVGVAISGGKDSMSLLNVMQELGKSHPCKLFAITVDEGIKGYRNEALANVKAFASRLGIPVILVSYEDLYGFTLDEALKARKNPEKNHSCAMCGPMRRRAIDKAAEKIDVDVVATAHNLDDFVQTFYINLFTGDLNRIKWLDPEWRSNADIGQENTTTTTKRDFGVRRIKPFMEIYEKEIALYAYLSGIPFQSESCPYMNEGIRSQVRDFLNNLEEAHPGIKYNIYHTILEISKGLKLAKDSQQSKKVKRCAICGTIASGAICSACKTVGLVRENMVPREEEISLIHNPDQ